MIPDNSSWKAMTPSYNNVSVGGVLPSRTTLTHGSTQEAQRCSVPQGHVACTCLFEGGLWLRKSDEADVLRVPCFPYVVNKENINQIHNN